LRFWGGNYDGEFHNGLLEIALSDGVYVDAKGRKVIDKGLYRGWDFSEGLAVAMPRDLQKWGYIDTTGEWAITPRYDTGPRDYVWPFEGGLAKVEVAGMMAYINHAGEFAIPPRFPEGDSFYDGMARVVVEGPCAYLDSGSPCSNFAILPRGIKADSSLPSCKYAFIDQAGEIISDQRYDDAGHFSEGLAPVRIGKLWGYVDKAGLMVIPPQFEKASPFSDGLAVVSMNGRFGYVDGKGQSAISPQFAYAEDFSEGLAVVGSVDSGMWYIDHAGKQAIPGRFAVASHFFMGLAHVKLGSRRDRTYAYIDRSESRVFSYTSSER
jgi:WG containing repeat